MKVVDLVQRTVAASAAAVLALSPSLIYAPTAAAISAYVIDPARDVPPPDSQPSPEMPMRQQFDCGISAVLANSQFNEIPISESLEVDRLHQFARGDGQKIAVIDSGVNPVSRLPRLKGGGDYIQSGDGLFDCDHHGTLVAGIIAAQPSPNDSFVGVAPGAEIISIRQTSEAFTEDRPPQGWNEADKAAMNLRTLARAVVHAADMGATVINISVTACVDASRMVDVRSLAGALYYASVVKNVVVVTSAGNTDNRKNRGCQNNPGADPNNPSDPRNWNGVRSVSLPSYFSDLVLSVGGSTLTGDSYINSMAGPWVGVAAPAINVVSLDPTQPQPGALTNAAIVEGTPIPINGTSFSAAYVAGLAALIREKYPTLTSRQVINRILKTAHTPADGLSNVLGNGIIDPVAALTSPIEAGDIVAPGVPSEKAPVPVPPPAPDHTGRNIALAVLGGAGLFVGAIALAAFAFRSPRS